MTPPEYSVLMPILGHIRQQLAGLDALLVSSGLALGPLDIVAAALPGARHVRFLPWCDLGFEDCGPEDLRSDVTVATQAVLGAEDLDVVVRAAPLAYAALGGTSEVRRKQRRLDGLFGSVAPAAGTVGALFIGEPPARALAVLEGATKLLATHGPAVVLPLDGSAASAAAAALLRRAGFSLHDQSLRPWPDGGPSSASWILASFANPSITASAPPAGHRFAWTIPIVEPLARSGFHPIEGVAPAAWSWIGPRPRAGLLLPSWPATLRQVGLQLRAVGEDIDLAATVAMVDGVPAAARLDGTVLRVDVPVAQGPRAFRRLDLAFPRSSRAARGHRLVVAAVTAVRLEFLAE